MTYSLRRSSVRYALLLAVLVTFTVTGFTGVAQAKKTYRFTMQNMFSMNHPVSIAVNQMAKDLKTMSDGQIQLQIVPPGALVKAPNILESVGNGAIDMGSTCSCYHGGILPVAATAFALPGDPRDVFDILHFIYDDKTIDFFREAYAQQNVYYGAPLVWDGYAIVSKKPINSWEDLKKMKVRASGSTAKALKSLEVPTVFIPFSEIYVALSRGTIDAEISGSHAESFLANTFEVAKYQVTPDVSGAQNCELILNKDRWEDLPANLQAVFETAMRECAFKVSRLFAHETKLVRAKMEAKGTQYVAMPDDVVKKWQETAIDLWDNVLAKQDPLSAKYIEMVKKSLKDLGYN